MTSDAAISSTLEGEYDGNGLSQLKDARQFEPKRQRYCQRPPTRDVQARRAGLFESGTGLLRGEVCTRVPRVPAAVGVRVYSGLALIWRGPRDRGNTRCLSAVLPIFYHDRRDKRMPGKSRALNTDSTPRKERSIVLIILFKHAMAGDDLS